MAKKGSAKATQAIEKLLEEKRQIEEWLTRLGVATDTTPEHVREKVQSDYRRRLHEIIGELQEHRDSLESALVEQRKRRDDLARREEAASERLAEAELRHTVGEYNQERWAGLKADILESLVKVREDLKQAEAQIAALEEIGVLMEEPGVAGATDGEEVILGGVQVSLDEDPPAAVPQTGRAEPVEPASGKAAPSDAFDELAFIKSVTEDQHLRPTPARPSGAHKRPSGRTPRPPPSRRVSGATQIGAEGVEALTNKADRPSKGTAAKTLKCAECGAQNLPTEWYCERCGAELAAL